MWIKRGRTGVLEVFFSKDFSTAVGAFESNNTVSLYKASTGLVLGSTASITDTKFHHIVFTKNGTRARTYVDGALAASTDSAVAFGNNSELLCLGSDSGFDSCTNNWFKGTIDDFRVYDRELSGDEVRQLYNAGR